jgi:hypothetical protein
MSCPRRESNHDFLIVHPVGKPLAIPTVLSPFFLIFILQMILPVFTVYKGKSQIFSYIQFS